MRSEGNVRRDMEGGISFDDAPALRGITEPGDDMEGILEPVVNFFGRCRRLDNTGGWTVLLVSAVMTIYLNRKGHRCIRFISRGL